MLSSPWIEKRAQLTPDRIAIECVGERVSYESLAEKARPLADGLADRGIQAGDVVGGLLHPGPGRGAAQRRVS